MAGVGKLKGGAARRASAALARIVHTPEPLDVAEARDRFDAMLGSSAAALLFWAVGLMPGAGA